MKQYQLIPTILYEQYSKALSVDMKLNESACPQIARPRFVIDNISTFSIFQISYNIICACYVYMFCLRR